MSSDLWAEFAASDQQSSQAHQHGSSGQAPGCSFFADLNTAAPKPPGNGISQWDQQPSRSQETLNTTAVDLDDDFGDFEDAPSITKPVTSTNDFSQLQDDPWSSLSSLSGPQQATKPQASSIAQLSATKDPFSADLLGIAPSGEPPKRSDPWASNQAPQPRIKNAEGKNHRQVPTRKQGAKLEKIAPDPDVLFDATPIDEDDDFGDFEGDASPPPSTNVASMSNDMQLLDLDAQPPAKQAPPFGFAPPRTGSVSYISHVEEPVSKAPGSGSHPSKPSQKKEPSKSAPGSDNTWDDFDDWDATAASTKSQTKPSKDEQTDNILSSIAPKAIPEPASNDLPPTNIPPPAPLLSLYLPIFSDVQKKFFKPLAAQPFHLKNRILSDARTIDFLKGYILLGAVAAHIIAGRKLRWKRDTHLSQGMRIGPASSRGTSGMKLATVDKSEMVKDDRQVLDIVRAWKEQLGRLRSAVAGANTGASANLPTVFELQENMPVRTAKESEGAVRAPTPCALCGLKRDERVAKVDVDIEDSFGEWWIDQMSMHRACRNFWCEHKENLKTH